MTESYMARLGPTLIERGYHCIPLAPGGKAPGMFTRGAWMPAADWSRHCDRATTENEVEIWSTWPECGIGIACGHLVGIDIDVMDADTSHAIRALAFDMLGETPVERIGQAPKRLLCYRADVPFRARDRMPIQILARGRQFAAFHIHPDTGQPYLWPETSIEHIDAADLLTITETQALAFLDAAYDMVPEHLRPKTLNAASTAAGMAVGSDPRGTREAVADALRHIPNADLDRESWVKIGLAIKGALGEGGRDLFIQWSRSSAKSGKSGKPDTAERKWKGFNASSIGAGTIYHLAGERGWKPAPDLTLNGNADELPEHPGVQAIIDSWSRRTAQPAATGNPVTEQDQAVAPQSSGDSPKPPAIPTLPDLGAFDPSEWMGLPVPPREWVWRDWLPIGYVTGCYAEGGVGKSLLLQVLLTCCATGRPFMGEQVKHCRAVGFFAEDELAELHRRQEAINASMGLTMADLGNMRFVSGVGRVNVLASMGRDNVIQVSPVFQSFERLAAEFYAGMIGIDTAATSFAGNEMDRSAVTQYVGGVLTGLAQRVGAAVLLNAHPSQRGKGAGGDGDSGSTGWNGSFRSRWWLDYPRDEKGKVTDNDRRFLSRKKANYAPSGATIGLEWRDGTLIAAEKPTLGSVLQAASGAALHLRIYLACLHALHGRGSELTDSPQSGEKYAPRAILTEARERGYVIDKRDIERAHRTALRENLAEIIQVGQGARGKKVVRNTGFEHSKSVTFPYAIH